MLNNCDFSKLYLKSHYHFNELKTAKNSTFNDILGPEKKHELCRPTIMKHYLKHNEPKYKYLQLEITVYKQCHLVSFVNSPLNLLTV